MAVKGWTKTLGRELRRVYRGIPPLETLLQHIYGLTKLVHLPILEGQTVVVVPRWDTEVALKAIQKYKATMMLLVPPVALILANGR